MNLEKFAIHQAIMKHLPTNEFLNNVAKSGFKNLSVWLPSLEDSINAKCSLEEINKIICEYKLNVVEVSPLHNWAFMTDVDREMKISEIHKTCGIAQKLNAKYICAPTLGKGDPKLALENLIILADIAASYKIKIAIEFVPGHQIGCLMTAWQLIRAANKDNVGILLDTILFFLGASVLTDLDVIPMEKLFLVHLSNLSFMADELDFTTLVRNYRTFPNLGRFDLKPLLKKLQHNRYCGYYLLEIFNKDFIELNAEIILQQAKNSIISLWKNLE